MLSQAPCEAGNQRAVLSPSARRKKTGSPKAGFLRLLTLLTLTSSFTFLPIETAWALQGDLTLAAGGIGYLGGAVKRYGNGLKVRISGGLMGESLGFGTYYRGLSRGTDISGFGLYFNMDFTEGKIIRPRTRISIGHDKVESEDREGEGNSGEIWQGLTFRIFGKGKQPAARVLIGAGLGYSSLGEDNGLYWVSEIGLSMHFLPFF